MASPHEDFSVDSELLAADMQPDAQLDQEGDQYQAELEAWKEGWTGALENVRQWGPKIATAYSSAREEVGGTIRQDFDEDGDPVPLEGKEKIARDLQPDVLIVDLALYDRSLRHPLPGDVAEQVHAAGWTILRREYPAPEATEDADEEQSDAPKKAAKPKADLLDELDEPAAQADDAEGQPEAKKKNMLVERVVVTHDGRIIRFEGTSDEQAEPDVPFRFARIRPDKELEEDEPEAFEKQKAVLTEYKDANEEKFVQPDKLAAVAILRPDTIEDANLNQLPEDAPEGATDYELQAWMLNEGLARFLAKNGLASQDYIDTLRS